MGVRTPIRHPETGFTLLELLVVLTIAALLLALVPPLLSGSMDSAQFRSSARDVAAGLRVARSTAIVENRSVALVMDVEQRSFRLEGEPKVRQLPQDVSITLNTAESELHNDHVGGIRFFPDGSATGGSVVLEAGGRALAVKVDWLTGRVLIEDAES